jgi:hypothetical protein
MRIARSLIITAMNSSRIVLDVPKKSAQKAQKAPYRASGAVQIRFLEDEETPAVSPHPANDSNLSHSSLLVIPTGAPKERSGGICSAPRGSTKSFLGNRLRATI